MAQIVTFLEELIQAEYGLPMVSTVQAEARKHAATESVRSEGEISEALAAGHLLCALADVRRQPLAEIFRWVGRVGAPRFMQSLPGKGREYSSTRSVLMQLNKLVQADLAQLLGTTEPLPEVDVELFGADAICIGIVASRETSALLEGFVSGCAEHFGERVQVKPAKATTAELSLRADRCFWEFDVLWERRTGASSLFTTPRRTKARDSRR